MKRKLAKVSRESLIAQKPKIVIRRTWYQNDDSDDISFITMLLFFSNKPSF